MNGVGKFLRITVLALFAFALISTGASADGNKTKIKIKTGKPKHAETIVRGGHGGPPPWAPAHGYRRKAGHGHRYLFNSIDFGRAPSFDLGGCNRDVIGMLMGAAAGGYVGSNIGDGSGRLAAVGVGVLLGGLLGQEFGDSLNRTDPGCMGRFMETTPDYQTVQWQNPDTGSRYNLMPSETYQDESGKYCREYQSEATVNGQVQQTYGTACRQPDGQWKLVN